MRFVIIAALLGTAHSAWAAPASCNINSIISHAWPQHKQLSAGEFTVEGYSLFTGEPDLNNPHQAICRVWPAHPELTLVAIPLMTSLDESGNRGDLEVLVANSESGEIQQRVRIAKMMNDDAIRLSKLSFDTARYKITENTTAFGLRIDRVGSSRANPINEQSFWLFTVDKQQLHPLIKGLVSSEFSGEWDGNCEGQFYQASRTLQMGKTSASGYADIIVTQKHTDSVDSEDTKKNCSSKETSGKATYRLKYNGEYYPLPAPLVAMPLE